MMLLALSEQWVEYILVLAQAAEDPLIDQGEENVVYIGILLLIIMVLVVIGILSSRAKIAILLALFLGAMLIAIILVV